MPFLQLRRLHQIICKLRLRRVSFLHLLFTLKLKFLSKLIDETILFDLSDIHRSHVEVLPVCLKIGISLVNTFSFYRRIMSFNDLANWFDSASFEWVLLLKKTLKATFLSKGLVKIVSIFKLICYIKFLPSFWSLMHGTYLRDSSLPQQEENRRLFLSLVIGKDGLDLLSSQLRTY